MQVGFEHVEEWSTDKQGTEGVWVRGAFNTHLLGHDEYEDYEDELVSKVKFHHDKDNVSAEAAARKFSGLEQLVSADRNRADKGMVQLGGMDMLAIAAAAQAGSHAGHEDKGAVILDDGMASDEDVGGGVDARESIFASRAGSHRAGGSRAAGAQGGSTRAAAGSGSRNSGGGQGAMRGGPSSGGLRRGGPAAPTPVSAMPALPVPGASPREASGQHALDAKVGFKHNNTISSWKFWVRAMNS
jgi:hypothetical protein